MTNLERETTEEFSKDAEAEKKTSKTQSHQGGKKTGITQCTHFFRRVVMFRS